MKQPKKPRSLRQPREYDRVPPKHIVMRKEAFETCSEELGYNPDDKIPVMGLFTYDEKESWVAEHDQRDEDDNSGWEMKPFYDDWDNFRPQELSLADFARLAKAANQPMESITLKLETEDSDAEYIQVFVVWKEQKTKAEHDAEMAIYENRFKQYEMDKENFEAQWDQFLKDTRAYELYLLEQKEKGLAEQKKRILGE